LARALHRCRTIFPRHFRFVSDHDPAKTSEHREFFLRKIYAIGWDSGVLRAILFDDYCHQFTSAMHTFAHAVLQQKPSSGFRSGGIGVSQTQQCPK
jgi:hypothetical protein